jgi:hypothetical protein
MSPPTTRNEKQLEQGPVKEVFRAPHFKSTAPRQVHLSQIKKEKLYYNRERAEPAETIED